jgi:subtilisin family serine protease
MVPEEAMKVWKPKIIAPKMACILLLAGMLFTAAPAVPPSAHASGKIDIRQKGNTVSLHASDASLRSVLQALGEKTGIRFVVHEGVPDRPVTFSIESMPLGSSPAGSVDAVLERIGLRNTVTSWDGETGQVVVHVLPEGKAYSDFVRGPSMIRIGQISTSAPGSKTLMVKGKKVLAEALPDSHLAVRYIQDEVMLKFQPDASPAEIAGILEKYGLSLLTAADDPLLNLGFVKASIGEGRSPGEVLGQLAQEPRLQSPEPNYVANMFQRPDPLYPLQWYIKGMGFDRLWKRAGKGAEIPVAVVDTGVDGRHPDLQGKVMPGHDFVHGSADAGDDQGHGTFVAGIIVANAGNGVGIRGLCDQARIIPVKVLDENGWGTYEDVARGIVYAADRGARVINLSLGGYGASWLLGAAVDYAVRKGSVVVAAGGNDGVEVPVYPAAYPGVIGVGALTPDGKPWANSNRGRSIDIFAPGVDIVSTGPNGGYVRAAGTSGAAPMVSALAAFLISERPDQSVRGIEQLIREEAKSGSRKQSD